MDFQYATVKFKPVADKPKEKPRTENVTWYEDGKFYHKDEQGTVWVSQNGKTWEVNNARVDN